MEKKETSVLVLDDEVNILTALKRAFITEPYDLFTTDDPDDALNFILKNNIKVVISDQRMAKISGVDFFRQVKSAKPEVVRILFTGFADMQAAEDAINKGEVYRFVNKPWNEDELKAIVRDALRHFDLALENKKLFQLTHEQNEELMRANEQLRGLYQKQLELTSTVSHELRTPLTAIKAAIDYVSMDISELSDDQKQCLDIAKRSVDRLGRLINRVLDLTKLESGATTLNLERANVNDIILDVIEIQRPVAEKKNLYLKADLFESMSSLYVDPDRISQVLTNLINNAIKFTDRGGIKVSSSVDAVNHCALFCVEDTGHGIPPEQMPKMFQKFQQLESFTRRVDGTGLGLAISKEIVEKHNGKIWAESEFGKGTHFYFALPMTS